MRKLNKVIYASSAMREEDFMTLFQKMSKIPGQQAQKFNRLMIQGIKKNDTDVYVITSPPINKSNCSSRVIALGKRKEGRITYRYLPIINIRIVKNVLVMLLSFLHTFFASINKDTVIVCDVLNISVAMGAVYAGRLLGKQCIGIVTDIPELMVTGHTKRTVKYCHNIINKCTSYVFLTEAMNDRLNPKGKPYTIVEGICAANIEDDIPSEAEKELSCLYAGLLDAEYGVKNMVDGFVKADIPNCVMHICGSGPYAEELKQVVSEHDNVIYHGSLFNKDVLALEHRVSLLINPRPSVNEFTKYSFPSKNMEYMASGTPVLTTKLPGMPEEYNEYVYLLEDETADGVCKALREILSKPAEELHQKGKEAKEFVLREKNNVKQAEKLLNLIGD